jgi:hypothetical protein
LQKNELDVFCGQISNNYPLDIFEVYKDSDNGLLYSFWQGKKIYLSSVYKNPNDAKAYLCSLCKEQDVNSPHRYNIDKLDFDNTDIILSEENYDLSIYRDTKKENSANVISKLNTIERAKVYGLSMK